MSQIELNRHIKSFTDISLSFEPSPVTGDLTVLRNERAISNAIRNIILTAPLEVVFNRDFGSTVSTYLFDLVDDGTAGLLAMEIKRAVNYNEPRVTDVQVDVEARIDQNAFNFRVQYTIVGWDETFFVDQILKPTR